MKQFKLKFTEENLNRHLSYDPICIYTLRDEMKGDCGDLTIIKSEIYFVYRGYTTTLRDLKHPKNMLWKKSGFSSQESYINEIQRIYGTNQDKQLYVMILIWLKAMSSRKCSTCKHFGPIVYYITPEWDVYHKRGNCLNEEITSASQGYPCWEAKE